MTVKSNLDKTYTLEEFMRLPDTGRRFELIDGKIIEVAPASEDHCRIGNKLNGFLTYFVYQHSLGQTYGADASFNINGNSLSPDIAFVKKGRLQPADRGSVVIPVAPDLAVEVKSSGDTWPEVRKKVHRYLQAGTRLVWVVDPPKQAIHIYRQDVAEVHILNSRDVLDGEDVVPGFNIPINSLFEYQ